jgi:hypothetical protein
LVCALKAAVNGGDARADVLKTEAVDEERKPPGANAQATLHGSTEAETKLIEPLVAAVDAIAEADQNGLRRETSIALSCVHQMKAASTQYAGRKGRDAVFNVVLRSCDQLSSCGRSGGAQVSGKVRNREVSLVTDGGYDRKVRGCDHAGKPFVIESCKVF